MKTQKKKTKGTPNSVDKHVGNRLRFRRSLMGLSQEKLGEAIGLTFQQIQKYEKGQNRISAGRLYQFGKTLDVPVSYFYENLQEPSSSGKILKAESKEVIDGDLLEQKETIDLVRAYYSIENEKMRKAFIEFLKTTGKIMPTYSSKK